MFCSSSCFSCPPTAHRPLTLGFIDLYTERALFGGAIAKTPTNQPTNRHTYIISGLAEPMKNTKYQIQYMERENMQNPHHVPAAN